MLNQEQLTRAADWNRRYTVGEKATHAYRTQDGREITFTCT